MKNINEQNNYLNKINEASAFLQSQVNVDLEFAIFTGTGLSHALSGFDLIQEIKYVDIPHFAEPTVAGHDGVILIIRHNNKYHIVFCGRHHYYEGYDLWETTLPIRVAAKLGVDKVIITNASGGVRSDLRNGDICLISDHIYLIPDSPTRGLTLAPFGERFPDPKNIYQTIEENSDLFPLIKFGTYVCLPGPHLETRAELRRLKLIGADLVGMSTIPEVLVATQLNLKVYAISVVTNVVDPEQELEAVLIEDVVTVAQEAIPKLSRVIELIFTK